MKTAQIDIKRQLKWYLIFNELSVKYPNANIQFVIDKTNYILDNNN